MLQLSSFTGGFTATNGYLLTHPEGRSVLIDAPEGIASWNQLQAGSLSALLLTHAHFDHVMDAAAVANEFQCPVYAFAPPSPDLTLEREISAAGMPLEIPPYQVDHLLEGVAEISVAGFSFQILHIPGHSPDSLCFLPVSPATEEEPIVLGGDVLFQRSIGRTDFPHSDHELLVRGIREKLYTLPEQTIVYPGHGPATRIGEERRENPFVRPEQSPV